MSSQPVSPNEKRYELPLSFYRLPLVKKLSEDIANGFTVSINISIDGKSYNTYTAVLACFLMSKEIKVGVYDNHNSISITPDSEVIIDGREYQKSYKKGYEKGVDFFNQNYKIDVITLYGPGLSDYISTLKYQCFEAKNEMGWGWESVKRTYLMTITEDIIFQHGYYSGIYSNVERLMKMHRPIANALKKTPPIALGVEKIINSSLRGEKSTINTAPTIQFTNVKLSKEYVNLFNSETDARFCLSFMNNLGLIDGDATHRIGDREKSRLMAFAEALQQKGLFPPARPTADITSIIAEQISLDYKRPRNGDRKKYDDFIYEYISTLNAVSTDKLTWTILVSNGR